jgi:hypothetical protein
MAAGTKEVYSGFVGMYNFKGNLGSGHYSIVRLAEVSKGVGGGGWGGEGRRRWWWSNVVYP